MHTRECYHSGSKNLIHGVLDDADSTSSERNGRAFQRGSLRRVQIDIHDELQQIAVDERYDGGQFFRASVSAHVFLISLHVLQEFRLEIPDPEPDLFVSLPSQMIAGFVEQLRAHATIPVLFADEEMTQLGGLSVVGTGSQMTDHSMVLVQRHKNAASTTAAIADVVEFLQFPIQHALGGQFEAVEVDEHGRDHGERRDGERDGPRVHEEVDEEHDETQDERQENAAEDAAVDVEKGLVVAEHQHLDDVVDPLFRALFGLNLADADVGVELKLNRRSFFTREAGQDFEHRGHSLSLCVFFFFKADWRGSGRGRHKLQRLNKKSFLIIFVKRLRIN